MYYCSLLSQGRQFISISVPFLVSRMNVKYLKKACLARVTDILLTMFNTRVVNLVKNRVTTR